MKCTIALADKLRYRSQLLSFSPASMFGKVTVFVNGVLLGALDIIYSDYTGSEVMPLSLSLWSCTVSSKLYLIPTKLATPLIGMAPALAEFLVQDENILYRLNIKSTISGI